MRAAHRPAPGRTSHFARGLHAVVDTETVVPGLVADVSGNLRTALIVPVVCYAIIASFGLWAVKHPSSGKSGSEGPVYD